MKHPRIPRKLLALLSACGLALATAASAQSIALPSGYEWQNVKVVAGGFITGIIPDPHVRGVMYVRTDIGGAYRIDPITKRWIPLTDIFNQSDWNLGGTESIAIDPTDSSRVYLAQGDYTETWAGNGAILRSHDFGITFDRVNLPIQLGANEPGRYSGERLSVDPQHPDILYFGSRNNGLWRSTDYGAHWAQVATFPVTGPTSGVGVIFVDFQPTTAKSETIYVGVSDTTTGLYSSTDGGATWTPVAGQPTGFYPTHQALSPDGTLYVTYADGTGASGMGGSSIGNGAVWKLNTSTGAWTNITPVGPWWTTSLWYGFGAVAVDRQHPSTLLVSTLDRWWPGDEVYRSLDGGTTWIALGSEPSGSEAGPLYNYSQRNDALSPYLSGLASPSNCTSTSCDLTAGGFGWWIGTVAIDPFDSNHALYGTGATIWETHDLTNVDSQQMIDWTVGANGIEETAITALVSPTGGAPLISGMGDLGGFRHADLNVSPAPGMSQPQFTPSSIDAAPNNPNIIVRVGGSNGAISSDNGVTWTSLTLPGSVQTAALSADGTRLVVNTSGGSPYYSTNQGSSWTASTGAPANDPVIADRVNPLKFYVFDANSGTVYVSKDGGVTFAAAATGQPGGTLSASPSHEGDLWIAASTGLFHSYDSGMTFNQIGSAQAVYSLGFGKPAPFSKEATLFISGQVGGVQAIFRSTDYGAHWLRINDNYHQWGSVSPVIGDPRVFGRVYIGTNGRGILRGDDPLASLLNW